MMRGKNNKKKKKISKKVEKKELSYIGPEIEEELLQNMETDSLEQEEGNIFVMAGKKCLVLFEDQPFQNITGKPWHCKPGNYVQGIQTYA